MYFILQLLHKWLIHKTFDIYNNNNNRKINEPETKNRWLKAFAMPSDYLWVGAVCFFTRFKLYFIKFEETMSSPEN